MLISSLGILPHRVHRSKQKSDNTPRFGRVMGAADREYWQLYQVDLKAAERIEPMLTETRCQELVEQWRRATSPSERADCRSRIIHGLMPVIGNFARAKAGSGIDLSELVQTGNTKVLTLIPSEREAPTEGNFFRFALRSVNNAFTDCFKKELLPSRRNALSTADVIVPSRAHAPDANAQSHEGIHRLQAAIIRLSEDDQAVVRAILDDKATGEPLAEALGTTVAAAQMRKTRALRRLQAILNPPVDDTEGNGVAKKKRTKSPGKVSLNAGYFFPFHVLFAPEQIVDTPIPPLAIEEELVRSRTVMSGTWYRPSEPQLVNLVG